MFHFNASRTVVFALLAANAVLVSPPAKAHYLWIERDNGATTLRFGEYEEGVIEHSPGRLDDIRNPSAAVFVAGAEKPVTLDKGSDGFGFAARNKSDMLIARETSMPVRDWSKQGIGLVKPMFYARNAASFSAAATALALDVTPSGEPGRFKVWFDGKPLAKATVEIIAPNGWSQKGKSDEDGSLTLPMPWRGQYIVQVIHKEDKAGEFEGVHFDAIRHRATLTIHQPDGAKTFAPQFQNGAAGIK